MTYYELIDNLRKLKISKDEEIHKKIINADITLYTDMEYRFAAQIIKFVANESHKLYKKVLDRLCMNVMNHDDFVLTIMDLSKEVNYLITFSNIKVLSQECKSDIKEIIETLKESYMPVYEEVIKGIYNEDYYNEYEEIMNRSEVNNEL